MVTLAPDDLGQLRSRVRRLEQAGVDLIGLGDSPAFHEPFVALAVAAAASERIRLGTMVTNLVVRHPRTVGQGFRSLAELAPHRMFVGVGAGDSALAGADRALAPPRFAEALDYLRSALPGGSDGGPVPIVVAANGPRTLTVAGGHADIAVAGTGLTAEALTDARAAVYSGRPDLEGEPIPVWVVARAAVAADRDRALTMLGPLLASATNHVLRVPRELAAVPSELREQVRRLIADYDYTAHGQELGNPNAALVEHLGLRHYLGDRFAVAGTAADVARGLLTLDDRGVPGVVLPAVGLDVDRLIDALGTEVMPALARSHQAPGAHPA